MHDDDEHELLNIQKQKITFLFSIQIKLQNMFETVTYQYLEKNKLIVFVCIYALHCGFIFALFFATRRHDTVE